jgi:hypothetical protein
MADWFYHLGSCAEDRGLQHVTHPIFNKNDFEQINGLLLRLTPHWGVAARQPQVLTVLTVTVVNTLAAHQHGNGI